MFERFRRKNEETTAPPVEPSEPEVTETKTVEVVHEVEFTYDEVRAILAAAGYNYDGEFYCFTPSSIIFTSPPTLTAKWTLKKEVANADNT